VSIDNRGWEKRSASVKVNYDVCLVCRYRAYAMKMYCWSCFKDSISALGGILLTHGDPLPKYCPFVVEHAVSQ